MKVRGREKWDEIETTIAKGDRARCTDWIQRTRATRGFSNHNIGELTFEIF